MQIISDFSKDVRQPTHSSGGYQWWYFDGISSDDRFSFVVILYEGNPFSTRFNGALLADENPSPADYPAISVSIYEYGTPIYYSFTEFDNKECHFDEDNPHVQIGNHRMKGGEKDERLQYELHLSEQLPNGDQLNGTITFKGEGNDHLFSDRNEISIGHTWNLVQPRADILADLHLDIKGEKRSVKFEGHGYHDQNSGNEPMRNEFDDWYWGRFHFDYATLVYYVMNRKNEQQHRAWLINNQNAEVLKTFEEVQLADEGLTLFGLKMARKLGFRTNDIEIRVQQSQLLDNGPFYQRYKSDAFLKIPDQQVVESTKGITEYIRPNRIYSKLFWPFVNMRIWYKPEGSHWVQRSKRLYRWTW